MHASGAMILLIPPLDLLKTLNIKYGRQGLDLVSSPYDCSLKTIRIQLICKIRNSRCE